MNFPIDQSCAPSGVIVLTDCHDLGLAESVQCTGKG